MGKLTISMVIFHSYVKLPEGSGRTTRQKLMDPWKNYGKKHEQNIKKLGIVG